MRRRTPIIAILLAPIALYGLVILWEQALVPIYRSIWYGDTVLQARLASDEPATRIGALKDVNIVEPLDDKIVERIVTLLETDESLEVRKAAAHTLGYIGATHPLPDRAKSALSTLLLTTHVDSLVSTAVMAVGRSAGENRYSDQVTQYIVEIFDEKRLFWVHPQSAEALGQIGAAQPLPGPVFDAMNAAFSDLKRPGLRENLAGAFAHIATRGALPKATVDLLIMTWAEEDNPRVRVKIIYALAEGAIDHSETTSIITAATGDADRRVQSAAAHALRIMKHNQNFGEREPIALALDRSVSIPIRLKALQIIKGTGCDASIYEDIVALATDDHSEVRIAALGLFHYLARSPEDDFDQSVLVPALIGAMSHPEPAVREAAVTALSTISMHRRGYRHADNALSAALEARTEDSDPRVRAVALAAMLQDLPSGTERDALLKRGISDTDAYVRQIIISWLYTPQTNADLHAELFEQARQDPDADVRLTAVQAEQKWHARKRAWPVELWQTWQAGGYGKVGLTVLTTVTVATPILIGLVFLIYFTARLLTYLYQRRWRALAMVPVMAIWATASYGMFMLYFAAGHAGNVDTGEMAVLVGALWGASAVYAGVGWGMHYAVRR